MLLELDQFRRVISEKKQAENYDDLQAEYGVNRYYLWHIINDETYEPPVWVCAKLSIAKYKPAPVCPIHNIVEQYDCRTQVVKPKPQPKQKKQQDRYPRYTAYWFESTKDWR